MCICLVEDRGPLHYPIDLAIPAGLEPATLCLEVIAQSANPLRKRAFVFARDLRVSYARRLVGLQNSRSRIRAQPTLPQEQPSSRMNWAEFRLSAGCQLHEKVRVRDALTDLGPSLALVKPV
jgi:hypothetical protein